MKTNFYGQSWPTKTGSIQAIIHRYRYALIWQPVANTNFKFVVVTRLSFENQPVSKGFADYGFIIVQSPT